MKKHISILLTVALVVAIFTGFSAVALASSGTLSITPSVSSMSSGGDVTFTAEISNSGSDTWSGYSIQCNGKTVASGDATLAPGTGLPTPATFTMNVTSDMLDKSIKFDLYTGGQYVTSDSVTIDKKVLSVKLVASGTVDSKIVNAGDKVNFSFKIENQGEATCDNIVVKASGLNDGKALNTGFSLAAGQSQTVPYTWTVTTVGTITPYIYYSVDGADKDPLKLEAITLEAETRDVEPVLTVDNDSPDVGEDVTFTLDVTNNGNVSYTDISVKYNGEEIDTQSSLKAGKSFSTEYTTSFDVSTDVQFTITLKDHKGATKTIHSNTISIALPVDADVLTQKVQLVMNVDRTELTSAGTVHFSGYINNTSDYTLSDIAVTETALGSIYEAPTIAAGAKEEVEAEADINDTTTYNFVLTVKDSAGKQYTINADPITVTIAADAEATTGFDEAADVSESALTLDQGTGGNTSAVLVIIAIVLVVLIIGTGVTLLILWKKGKRPQKLAAAKTAGERKKTPAKFKKRPANRSYKDRNNF